MVEDVYMPKFGMTMEKGEIVKWKIAVGDSVKRGDSIAEIVTEKITNDLEAQSDGVVEAILVEEGDSAKIGEVIARISIGA